MVFNKNKNLCHQKKYFHVKKNDFCHQFMIFNVIFLTRIFLYRKFVMVIVTKAFQGFAQVGLVSSFV